MRRLVTCVFLGSIALATVTVGCSNNADPRPTEPPSAITPEQVSPPDLPDVPELDAASGVRADVEINDCETDAPLTASGTVINASGQTADFLIVVNWATDRGDVLARGIASLQDLEPNSTVDWEVVSDDQPSADVSCVVNAQKGILRDG